MLARGAFQKLCSKNVGAILSSHSARLSSSYDDHHFKFPTMDELPVPQGSWQEEYNRKQKKYNLHLVLGVGFAILSIAVAKQSGLFYLNFYPPERPADR